MSIQAPITEGSAPDGATPERRGMQPGLRHIPVLIPPMASAISGYVLLAVVGRRLGHDQFGSAAALVACALILSVPGSVFQVARTPSAKRAIDSGEESGRSTALSRTLAALVAVSFVILALTPALDAFLHIQKGASGLLAPYFFLASVAGIVVGASRDHLDAPRYGGVIAARLLVDVAFGLVFVHRGLGVVGVLLALVIGEAAVLLMALTLFAVPSIRPRSASSQKPLLPELAPADAGIAAAVIGSLWLLSHFDVLLAQHYLAPGGANPYAVAWAISRVFLAPLAIILVDPFRVSAKSALSGPQWLRRLLGLTWGASLASVGLLLALRHQVVSLLFGPGVEPAERLVPALALAMGLFAVAGVLSQFHLIARSHAFLLLLAPFLLLVALSPFFHANDDHLVLLDLGTAALAAGGLYHAAMAITRWSRPLGALSPHEELVPATGFRTDRSPVELSIVLPCHNAGSQLEEFIVSLQGHLDPRAPTEIIVVSDGSTDDTVRIAGEFASDAVRVFHYPERLGKGHALRVGLHQARGEYVAFIDSDGDIDPQAIVPFFSLMQLYQPDIVLASKRHPLSQVEYPRLRRILSWVYHVIGRVLFRVNVRDTQTGLKLIRKDVLSAVLPKMLEKRYAFDLELLVVARRLGYTRIFEAPVKIHYRFTSNVDPAAAFRILVDTGAIFYRRYVLNTYGPLTPVIEALPSPTAVEEAETAPESPKRSAEVPPARWPERLEWVRKAERALRPIARPWVALTGMITLYIVVFGRLTWLQHSHFGTFGFDMGIFDQEVWLLSHFKAPFSTIQGQNIWGLHINPNLYLLAPFYWLGAGPHFLYLAQTIGLALGAVPLWLLARDRFGNSWIALGIPVAWLLYPSVQWMTWWPFHPEYLAVAPLLFAWWLATRHRWGWYALCVALVLTAKEDAAFAVLVLGLIVALRHDRKAGLLTALAAVGWFVVSFAVIFPLAVGTTTPWYAGRFSTLGSTTRQIAFNLVRHPSRVVHVALKHDRYSYYWKMLAPVGGLALLAPTVFLIAVPTMLVNVLSDIGYNRSIMFQYQAVVSAGIFLAVIEFVGRMKWLGVKALLTLAVVGCALAANVVWSPSPLNQKAYHSGIWALYSNAHQKALEAAVGLVPAGVPASASYDVVSHLTHRTAIYEFPNPWVEANWFRTKTPADPRTIEYLVIDTGLNPDTMPLLSRLISASGPFQVIFDRDGAVVAKRVTSAPGG